MSFVFSIAVLAILIVVHEFGHMIVAKWCGMRVEKFSIFFGPSLFKWQRGTTTYSVGSIPLGGYVRIAGMNPEEKLPADDMGSYQNQPAWKRFAAIAAGPAVNYLFAILLMAFITLSWGIPMWLLVVGDVAPQTPAAAAGMRPGDEIQSINGARVLQVEHVVKQIKASAGDPLRMTLIRDGQPVKVTLRAEKTDGVYRIGIAFGQKAGFMRTSVGRALAASFYYPWMHSKKVFGFIGKLFSRQVSAKNVGGPVAIVQQLKRSFDTGLSTALLLAAMLSVFIGLFNLLPLPALDGGRLAFLIAEMVARRRINQKIENAVHAVGFLLLIGVLLLVSYGDIRRVFGG